MNRHRSGHPRPNPDTALPTWVKPVQPKFYILNLFALVGFVKSFQIFRNSLKISALVNSKFSAPLSPHKST